MPEFNSSFTPPDSQHTAITNLLLACGTALFLVFGTTSMPANASCSIGDYLVTPDNPIEVSDPGIVQRITGKIMPPGSYQVRCVQAQPYAQAEMDLWPLPSNHELQVTLTAPAAIHDPATAMINTIEF